MLLPSSVAPVFISYRRADARHAAARLRDSLTDFQHPVWFDVDDIPSALPYRSQIATALRECEVALVVIGPQWATVSDGDGRRRLDDPDDDVRLEVEMALRRSDLTLVPVLVDHASMPARDELPGELRRLCELNAARLDHESWRYQVRALHGTIEAAARRRWATWGEALAVGTLAAIPAAAIAHGVLPDTAPAGGSSAAVENLSRLALQRAELWAVVMAAVLVWVAWRRPARRWSAALRAGLLWGAAFGILGALVHALPTYFLRDALPDLGQVGRIDGSQRDVLLFAAFALGIGVTGAGIGALIGAAWNPSGVGRGLVVGLVAGCLLGWLAQWVLGGDPKDPGRIAVSVLLVAGIVGSAIAVQWLTRARTPSEAA